MAICTLCKNAEADKKGSHVIPHFLIKGAINQDGRSDRDMEISFSLTKKGFPETYFGKSVLPEKIEEVLGKTLTEEEIQKNINPYTQDNVFCTACEKRFGKIESWFATNIYSKLGNPDFKTGIDSKNNDLVLIKPPNSYLSALFIHSIVWRCSALKFDGFAVAPQLEELLRNSLNDNLSFEENKVINDALNSSLIKSFPLVVTYSYIQQDLDTTSNMIYLPKDKIPYCLLINDLTIQLFEKAKHVQSAHHYFLGIPSLINLKKDISFLAKEESMQIIKLDNAKREKILSNIQDDYVRGFINHKTKFFRELFIKLFGTKPPEIITQYFQYYYLGNKTYSGDMYSMKNFAISAYKAICHYIGKNPDV